MHLHVFPKGVKETHPHVTDETSYAPHPNQDVLKKIFDLPALQKAKGLFSKRLSAEEGAEAEYHRVIANKHASNLKDFTDNATDEQWTEFRKVMVQAATGTKDGVRFVFINDLTDFFCIHALGGENLAQEGQVNEKNPQRPGRWFDKIKPAIG